MTSGPDTTVGDWGVPLLPVTLSGGGRGADTNTELPTDVLLLESWLINSVQWEDLESDVTAEGDSEEGAWELIDRGSTSQKGGNDRGREIGEEMDAEKLELRGWQPSLDTLIDGIVSDNQILFFIFL